MLIIHRIINIFSCAAVFDQPGRFQETQLVGDRRNAEIEGDREVADTKLLAGQGMQDADPGLAAEGFKSFCQESTLFLGEHLFLHIIYGCRVEAKFLTGSVGIYSLVPFTVNKIPLKSIAYI